MTPERFAQVAEAGHLLVRHSSQGGRAAIAGNDPILATPYPIGEAAAAALVEVGDAAAQLSTGAGGAPGVVTSSAIEGALATISFALTTVDGVTFPRTNWANPYVSHYRCADSRWIFLHGGFPNLQQGLATLLGLAFDASYDQVGAACGQWDAFELENAIAKQNLCGAVFRTAEQWGEEPQGQAVNGLETVVVSESASRLDWEPTNPARPLAGLRVLDLTRVLAGPACGRTLAAFGADVLQVTGPDVPNVPAFVVDTGHGKRRAFANLTNPDQAQELRRLAMGAHVIVQGYRPGVVVRFGLDSASLRADGFCGVYASVSCFGPEGPFVGRAGWEQIAQTVSGLAVGQGTEDVPELLPAAATDYTTGIRLAGAILRSLQARRANDLHGSLCQTAAWLQRLGPRYNAEDAAGIGAPHREEVQSGFGLIGRLGPGVQVEALDVSWHSASPSLGSSSLTWLS